MTVEMPPAEGTPASDGSREGLSVTFVGTATVLMRYGALTILTDPNFLHRGERAYVGMGLWTKRLTEPALGVEQLPPLDFVLLSHHHADHFDRRAAEGLDKDLPIVTNAHAAAKLYKQGFRRPVALATWEERRFQRDGASVVVTSVPGKHAPAPLDRVVPPVMGSVLDFSGAGGPVRCYVTGDTLLHEALEAIPVRFPDIDLCLVHLGGTRIAGVLLTLDGPGGASLLRLAAPRAAIPIHFDDYTLFRSPLSEFREAVGSGTGRTEVVYLGRGETWHLPPRQRSRRAG
jgi:L-ascorbate metabolism protein UlaG (beta-lactamase superfamily)